MVSEENKKRILVIMKVQILVDNPNSWIIPYADELVELLKGRDIESSLHHTAEEITSGDILCLLSCEKLFKSLNLNKYNLVIHESDLPKGKGWSPVSWQVLEGKTRIPVTLFEAAEGVDSGDIYTQEFIELTGTELWTEIKHQQGVISQKLILNFVDSFPEISAVPQKGESTFYPKRTAKDSELDVNQSIKNQFNLLRVCDNERYPAFFKMNGEKFIIKIYKG